MKHITVAAKHPLRTIRWQSIYDDEAAIRKWANPQSVAKQQSDNGGKSSGRAEATTKHPSITAKYPLDRYKRPSVCSHTKLSNWANHCQEKHEAHTAATPHGGDSRKRRGGSRGTTDTTVLQSLHKVQWVFFIEAITILRRWRSAIITWVF